MQGSFAWGTRSVPALVTVPLPPLQSRVEFVPSARPGVRAGHGTEKARRAAQLTLRLCRERGLPRPAGGQLRVESAIPSGCGMGSSTADVIATIRAVGHCCSLRLTRGEVSELARRAETASDPLAFGCEPVLFAQRHARVLRHWPRAFPPVHLVGCRLPGGPVETLALDAQGYTPHERRECLRILHLLERCVGDGDARALGEAATRSALLNQTRLPKPALPELLAVSRETGGVGVQVAHSGTVCAVLLDARRPGAAHRAREARTALDSLGLERTVDMIWGGP
ncbi:hypothetical protein CWC38_00410 [Kocuria tytonicola]|uniref:GHMP family kinase ATP-binding protein n=1 Tax=Kocuria tytonicola TaxID=2055946 RepID=UPI000EF8CD57|nr:hypothetical protein [Kocuria tytonicola]RLZ04391.1 hypothetical protein CWC38_00410 [Kocuria tytonicola]